MRYFGVIFIFVILVLNLAAASGVSRSFVEDENVSLYGYDFGEVGDVVVLISVVIDTGSNNSIYIIEENVPSGLEVVQTGSAARVGNALRWFDIDTISGVDSVNLTYVVRGVNGGRHLFSGSYGMDNMDSEAIISGAVFLGSESVVSGGDSGGDGSSGGGGSGGGSSSGSTGIEEEENSSFQILDTIKEFFGNEEYVAGETCGEWGECVNGTSVRSCLDGNGTGVDEVRECGGEEVRDYRFFVLGVGVFVALLFFVVKWRRDSDWF
jgi:hypothetical protein